ncbi:OLC1v1003021C1 [Oldenlandia corymbosa var. corymbosa]|uniref:OLC1v1003021C1 n=1 Tax=Oldenlandia corymbosa var. corymbosa TaxID=529605 RepID=A0AAV1D935_OLDCO|nr:OLC1v1003021C1 [Oldenlandia corymbosa var. corymbosa]
MESISIPRADPADIAHDFFPFLRVYKDGRVDKFLHTPLVPPSDDPNTTGALSKDVFISPENKVGARLFLPKTVKPDERLPVLVYFHGGAFVIESAFSAQYTAYLNSVVAEANVIAVSVEYRLAPEHKVPACYEDSWAVTKWVESHSGKQGPDPWLNDHADFGRVFFAGDSAGANIAHNMAVRASNAEEGGIKPLGLILAHPFFGNGKPDKLWQFICSDFNGWEDLRLNPMAHPNVLAGLVCKKVLIVLGETDFIRDRGVLYHEALKKSGWNGELEVVDFEKEGHVFHLLNQACENAGILMKKVVSFLSV